MKFNYDRPQTHWGTILYIIMNVQAYIEFALCVFSMKITDTIHKFGGEEREIENISKISITINFDKMDMKIKSHNAGKFYQISKWLDYWK